MKQQRKHATAIDPSVSPDALIPRAEVLRNRIPCSRVTAFRREQADPQWPTPIVIGPRVFYRASEVNNYIATRHAAAVAAHEAKREARADTKRAAVEPSAKPTKVAAKRVAEREAA